MHTERDSDTNKQPAMTRDDDDASSTHAPQLTKENKEAAVGGKIKPRKKFFLCLLCLAVFAVVYTNVNRQRVQRLSSSFAAVLEQRAPHPHAGARDARGYGGYVANVTAVRRWMVGRCEQQRGEGGSSDPLSFLPFANPEEENEVCNREFGRFETPKTFELLRKVRVGAPNPLPPLVQAGNTSTAAAAESVFCTSGKILCGLYTYSLGHERVTSIAETWGWRCDGFFAASNQTVDQPGAVGFGAIDLLHEGPES